MYIFHGEYITFMRPGLLGMIETGITSYTNRMNIGSPATMGLPSRPRSDLL